MKISLVINTLNAEKHVAKCIDSCNWADEIIVVDMHSSDKTCEIALSFNAKIYQIERMGYVEPARNFALSKATHEWIVLLDADERLQCERAELETLLNSTDDTYAAIEIRRVNHIGEWTIKDSGWKEDYQVRLLRKGRVEWKNAIHSRPNLMGNLKTASKHSPVWIDHLNFSGVQELTTKLNHYASKEPAPQQTNNWNYLLQDLRQEFSKRYTPESDGALSLLLAFQMLNYKLLIHAYHWERSGLFPMIPEDTQDISEFLNSKETSVNLRLELIDRDNEVAYQSIKVVPTGKNSKLIFDLGKLLKKKKRYKIRIKPSETAVFVSIKGLSLLRSSNPYLSYSEKEVGNIFTPKNDQVTSCGNSDYICRGHFATVETDWLGFSSSTEKVILDIEIDADAWRIRFHQACCDYQEEINRITTKKNDRYDKLSTETEERRQVALGSLVNNRLEKEFRSRYLRPKSRLRKLTSRKYKSLDKLLPEATLGIDTVKKIANHPDRVKILKNALDLKVFNSADYLTEYPDIMDSGINPFFHYLSNLWPEGISPVTSPDICNYLDACFENAANNKYVCSMSKLPREASPLVSIIVVNYNGIVHLPDLLQSLHSQDYLRYEILLVDNASTDGSIEYIAEKWPKVKLIQLQKNVGFAEGNNIGQEAACGRLICLLNNDTCVQKDWLSKLVEEWKLNDEISAVCSKVVFWKPFVELKLAVTNNSPAISISEDSLQKFHPEYRKYIFKSKAESDEAGWFSCSEGFSVHLPYEGIEKSIIRFKNSSDLTQKIKIVVNDITLKEANLQPGINAVELELPYKTLTPQYLINNAGSDLTETTLEASDRGINEYDLGQYNEACDVTAICGCSVLIDPIAINNSPLFCKDFFAYYEDTDLSLRLRKQGFTLRYAPGSVVYHKHASSSQENSPFFRYHVARNKLYLNMLHTKEGIWKPSLEGAKKHFWHMQTYYAENTCTPHEKEFGTMIPKLIGDLETFEGKVRTGDVYSRNNHFKHIGIYNTYWNTAGGGEHHALMFAQYFSKYGIVDLISETDFDLDAIASQFNLQLKNCRKRILQNMTPELTEDYDVFINTTFCSTLISRATHSYYILSFPHHVDLRESHTKTFLHSYTFLANSEFTQKWTKHFWKKDSTIIYPSIELTHEATTTKEALILNVGRFFISGHNKKQLELAQNFARLKERRQIPNHWKLILAGKIQKGSEAYAHQIKDKYSSYGIELHTDLTHSELKHLYQKAFIYWHATGLGEEPDKDPYKFEHFGITTCEALSHSCIPVVHNSGGQPEIIEHNVNGFIFDTEDDLQSITADLIKRFESKDLSIELLQKAAHTRSNHFSRKSFFTRLEILHPIENSQNSL